MGSENRKNVLAIFTADIPSPPNEVWVDIVGYEGLYAISNLGRVKAHPRRVWNGVGYFTTTPRILKYNKGTNGYLSVQVYKDKKRKSLWISRLVAQHFIPNPLNKPCVDHIDTDRSNNSISNLRWVTHKENNNNPLTIQNRLHIKKVICDTNGEVYNSITDVYRRTHGTSLTTVYRHIKRGYYQGKQWRILDD